MLFDGSVINSITIVTGLLALVVRPVRRKIRKAGKCWATDKAVVDFLNGSTAVPFVCLALSAVDPAIIPSLIDNKVTMAVAGCIGFIFVAGEILAAGRED